VLVETTILRFRLVLDAAASSTKNADGECDPEMKQSKKGKQWYFGMKAHIGVDAESGLVHTVRGTTGSANDVTEANALLHTAGWPRTRRNCKPCSRCPIYGWCVASWAGCRHECA